jgi:hypothetical protein
MATVPINQFSMCVTLPTDSILEFSLSEYFLDISRIKKPRPYGTYKNQLRKSSEDAYVGKSYICERIKKAIKISPTILIGENISKIIIGSLI